MSLFDSASLVITPNGTKASKLYSIKPTDGSGDLSVTRATTATRVNSSGLIESVSANVPRLDYSNGSCPSILVEPQRTNLALYSEQFNDINWVKDGLTVSSNSAVSPDGNTNADKLIGNASDGNKISFQIVTSTIGTSYTTSAFFKASEYNLVFIRFGGVSGNPYVIYNLSNQSVISSSGSITNTIKLISNNWYKITATVTATTTIIAPNFSFLPTTGYTLNGSNVPEYTGNGVNGGFIWGAQLEAGSYATSYIPTTSASVTRNADVISKTGISSLIGQTEGTLFIDVNFKTMVNYDGFFIKDNASFDTFLFIQKENDGKIVCGYYGSGALQVRIETAVGNIAGRYKIAFGYKNNDFVFYVNGVQIGTDTSGTLSGLIDFIDLNWTSTGNNAINTTALWKTRLSNSELATLTTI